MKFIEKDRRYAFLSGTVLAALNLIMWMAAPAPNSFLGVSGGVMYALWAVCGVFAIFALAACVVKLSHWDNYSETAFKTHTVIRVEMWLFWLVVIAFAITAVDRVGLKIVNAASVALAADNAPRDFFGGMVYTFWNGRAMFWRGIKTTVLIALFGTAIAFVLAVIMVALRVLNPTRQDNDFVRFWKKIGRWFSQIYITVIRGTPMMVQSLILYYAVFNILKATTSMSITEITQLWSGFTAGLITVSLNSTAYLAEVLRGGIESIDAGQMEAARSLGMTNWQAMLKVIFPQAVKNSIPAIGNEFIINIKDSSVLSVISCFDLMFATTSVSGIYFKALEVYCIAAIIYLILTYLSSLLMKAIARKLDTPAKGVPSSN